MALLFLPVIILYLFSRNKKYFIPTLLGIGLSAFFWLPAIYDLQYTIFNQTHISDWKNYFSGIDQIGLANIFILILSIFIFFFNKKNLHKSSATITILFFIITAVAVFIAIPVSAPLWKLLPVSFIQFPFRILSVCIIGFSYLTAFLLNSCKIKIQKIAGILLVVILLSFSSQYILKNEYFDKGDAYYSTNEATTTVKNEYMPKWVKVLPIERPQQKVILPDAVLSNLIIKPNKIIFSANVAKKSDATINMIYFPGWHVYIDGNDHQIRYNNPRGLFMFSVPSGNHNISIKFEETPVRIISDLISLISLVIIISLKLKLKRKK